MPATARESVFRPTEGLAMDPSLEQRDEPADGNVFRRLIDSIRTWLLAFNDRMAMQQKVKELAARNDTLARNRDFCRG
jgi:hypothetical protein